nr:PREDICTED: uncharacterized protein LOC107398510 [Tribolium castaneum]|eukprot:XP_015838293.1 PREDICTED: uncharacterized protein LOC107398510 [Tribolium castaneum]
MKFCTLVMLLFPICATLGVRLECYTCPDCGKTPDTWNQTTCSLFSTEHYLCEHRKFNGTVVKSCISNVKEETLLCDKINKKKKKADEFCFYCERDLCNVVNSAKVRVESCVVLLFVAVIVFVY